MRIARYSSPRSSILALSLTAGFVLVLFIGSFLTHLPNATPEHMGTVRHSNTVETNDFGISTSNDHLDFLFEVLRP